MDIGPTVIRAIAICAAAALLLRQRFGPLAAGFLFAGLVLLVGAGYAAFPPPPQSAWRSPRIRYGPYDAPESVLEMLGYLLRERNFDVRVAFRIFAMQAAAAALLVAGMLPRFTRQYIRGARPKD